MRCRNLKSSSGSIPLPELERFASFEVDGVRYFPKIACELECYIPECSDAEFEQLTQQLSADPKAPKLFKAEREKGEFQFEFALTAAEPLKAAEEAKTMRRLVLQYAAGLGLNADFRAMPFEDQPGSGLHVHLSLHDGSGAHLFSREEDVYCPLLLYALGGLMAKMEESLAIFAPTEESRRRFQPGHMAPTTISWGGNNRTTALRIPPSFPDRLRIEHRVPSADADPHEVLLAILHAVKSGIAEKRDPGPKIWGDAGLAMYGMPTLK